MLSGCVRPRLVSDASGDGNPTLRAIPMSKLHAGDLTVDISGHRAWRGEVELSLTPTEFRLLVSLMRRAGEVVSKAVLFEECWRRQDDGRFGGSHLVEVHLANLRRKLHAVARPSSTRSAPWVRSAPCWVVTSARLVRAIDLWPPCTALLGDRLDVLDRAALRGRRTTPPIDHSRLHICASASTTGIGDVGLHGWHGPDGPADQ